MILFKRMILVVVFLIISTSAAYSENIEVSSSIIRAVQIAYADFENRLASRDDREGELAEYILNPKNYDIGISQTRNLYIVVFLPRKLPPNEYLIGGGGQYLIRKADLTILKFIGYK